MRRMQLKTGVALSREWRRALCCVAFALACGTSAAGRAQVQAQDQHEHENANERDRYVVLVLTPANPEIMARLRGQTGDLPLTLRSVETLPRLETPLTWRAFVAEQHAQAVVRIDERAAEHGFVVSVIDGADGEAHERQVQPQRSEQDRAAADGDAALAQSAAFEQLAIIVRSELALLLAAERKRLQTRAGVSADASASGSENPRATKPTPHANMPTSSSPAADGGRPDAPSSSDTVTPPDAAPWGRVRPSLAWELALAGSDHVAHAAAIRCGVGLGALELTVGGALGLPSTLRDARARATIARHGVELGLAFVVPVARALHLGLGVRAGVLGFSRSTRVRDTTLSATGPTTSLAAALGPELMLRLRVFQNFGFQLVLRSDFVLGAPRYAVEQAGTTQALAHESLLEPAAALGMFFAL